MPETDKVLKLSAKLKIFIKRLDGLNALVVHQRIDQFYYMQKLSELEVLTSRLEDIRLREENVIQQINKVYNDVGREWSKDVRWLNLQNIENHIDIPLH